MSELLTKDQIIGGCRVEAFLGAGAMGQVYRCKHLALERLVALKILPSIDQDSIQRFLREARLAAKIEHPNVVTIHDVGMDRNSKLYYIIMQYIAGHNLADMVKLQKGPLPWRTALKLISGAAQGTAAVHDNRLIHRDIKPANIMHSPNDRRVKLMDFGLVRESSPTDPSRTLGPAGTPVFMSPEQCRGADLDHRSDIVSLGGSLYFLLTGNLPYSPADPNKSAAVDVMDQIIRGKVPAPVHIVNPAVPGAVSSIVAQAMAHHRDKRFSTALAMARAIDRVLRETRETETASLPSQVLNSNNGAGGSGLANGASRNLADTSVLVEGLELIVESSPTQRPPLYNPAWWFAGVLGVCLLVALAWLLNRPSSGNVAKALDKGADKVADKKVIEKTSEDTPPVVAKKNMVRVPGGLVLLGNSEAVLRKHCRDMNYPAADAEGFLAASLRQPETKTTVSTFWIDKYEVTHAEYYQFVVATSRAAPKSKFWVDGRPSKAVEDHPVVTVSHADALAYAIWAGKNLPTNVQWLRAYRGEKDILFPWGNTWEKLRANVSENTTVGLSSPVAATPDDVSEFGVYNLVGNADEILRDIETRNGLQVYFTRGAQGGTRGSAYGSAAFPREFTVDQLPSTGTGFRCVVEEPK